MATKPTVSSATVGGKISAALWNASVKDAWDFLDLNKPVCLAYQTLTQSMATGTLVSITMDSEVIDRDGQHSTSVNTSRITIGNTLGLYRVWGGVAFAGGAGSLRRARLLMNGSVVPPGGYQPASPVGSGFSWAPLTPIIVAATAATDYVELQGFHDAGVSLSTLVNSSIQSFFAAEYIGS